MKKMLLWFLLAGMLLSLWGCSSPEETVATTEHPRQVVTSVPSTIAETEPAALEGSLYLKVSSITFSLVGESENVYLGLIPRELATWESDNPSIVSVENGVLTANGVGSTIIHATYYDRQVSCTAQCLAQTQAELDSLDAEILSSPKRVPPDVDLNETCTYFDNAAIFGDSITYFLWQFESQNDYLGNLQFVTRQGISVMGLALRYKNMYFKGREAYIEDIAAQCGAQRVYLMLGCLDFQFPAGRDTLMDNWTTILDRIQEKCPDTEIVIISAIPSFTREITPSETNNFIAESNIQLKQLATEKGCGFWDLSYYIEDHYERMPELYSKDEYHMNDEGSLVWIKIMRYYAQFEHEGGTLS